MQPVPSIPRVSSGITKPHSQPCHFRQINRRGSSSSISSRPSSPSLSRCSSPLSAITSNGLITPISSRPGSPLNNRTTFNHSRRTHSSSSTFTSLIAPLSPALSSTSDSSSLDMELLRMPPSTATWDCATAVVSNQKVQTSYEKAAYTPETQFDSNGEPIPGTGNVTSYGRMLTKTVTMTVTTTIASTEILHPDEEGYEASMERQRVQELERRRQQQQQQSSSSSSPTDMPIKKEYVDDVWSSQSANGPSHDSFHADHHHSANATGHAGDHKPLGLEQQQ